MGISLATFLPPDPGLPTIRDQPAKPKFNGTRRAGLVPRRCGNDSMIDTGRWIGAALYLKVIQEYEKYFCQCDNNIDLNTSIFWNI
jgi:hypothetical protein